MDGAHSLLRHPEAVRLPPANLEAEQACLGAILANNKAYDRVADFLRADHFADPVHARIYAAMRARIEAGQLADAVTLRNVFEHSGALDDAGGPAYLAQLLSAMVGIINAGEYGRLIHDCWLRRQIIERAQDAMELAYGTAEPELAAAEIRDRADASFAALAQDGAPGAVQDMATVAGQAANSMAAAIARGGGLAGVSTGLAGLDRMTGGLRGGQLVVVGARASMGKTALGARIAMGAAEAGARVLFVTIEMVAESIVARMMAGRLGYPLNAVLRGLGLDSLGEPRPLTTDSPDLRLVGEEARRMAALPLTWLHHGAPTTAMVRGHARGLQRRGGLDLVVVDYLGLLRPAERVRDGNRVQEIGLVTRELKAMAVDLALPVLALAQLSRAVENREDQRPRLSDLRDSGEIEQHADIVGLLYREHYYLKRAKPARKPREKEEDFLERVHQWQERLRVTEGRAELDIAKQRQGPVGPVRLRFHDVSAWFDDDGRPPPDGD
ncbi:DnaB-like helicase C-terminal domain-containing protein [Roseococcus microcysteis]|uniref:DnaB-like helicase C-terminal domain-containing protein n=1 Tax=Roseococcus microcysteis TaxID=2771361 RepID=UPI00168A74DA|nr:DnaB-like helicase C-terminal domain-containing protein [Roseococcus microcysteis]